jgi:signal transduction histidine kinase
MVCLSLRYGSTEASAPGYVWFGVVLGFFFKKYREGYAFGLLAREFVERGKLSSYRGNTLFAHGLVSSWAQPLATSRECMRESFQQSLQTGDYQMACYSSNQLVKTRLSMGDNLDELFQETLALSDFVRKCGFLDVQDIHRFSQGFVQQMRGLSRSFDTLSWEDFDERAFEAGLSPARMSTMRFWYWLTKLQSRFMCGAYREALEAADQAAGLRWAMIGTIQLLDFHLYRALSLAALHEERSEQEQQQGLEELEHHRRQLEEWAGACPATFRAPERMVSAELARVTGRLEEALRAYEEAIVSARESGFLQHVGVASELAANSYRKRQAPLIAEAYAREARLAYLRWGALGKVQQLDTLWPHLAPALAPTSALTTDTDSTRLDALTVVKAQQAISSELDLEKLVATLMRVALENVGAQRGALLLLRGDKLEVAARMDAVRGELRALPDDDAGQGLPWAIVSYVKRTHEHVLISDASRPHPFSSDPYLKQSKARSVLCLPLMRQGAFSGAMYLENELASGAFTPARLSVLEHLASQAAISLQTAQLYAELQRAEAALRHANDELERRVEERTRALKEMQAQLVDTARAAGMAEIASNVLHNVGNVLTSAVINLEVMRTAAESSRVGRLKQLSALVEEHRGSLTDFLARDPRGSRLPDYLSALTGELLREQAQLRENLEAMNAHVEHIRTIVQVQQTYAKSALLLDECDLAQLVEDALRIQLAALQRHGITLSRELASLPKVRLDKHKVLQILVNLVSNAKYAMDGAPEGQRHLHVRLSAEGKVARLQVVDSGIGFTPEVRKHLFSHGFTTRKEGHGFGLHSSALAAQLLGGRLLLESAGPGRGATATLELPLP